MTCSSSKPRSDYRRRSSTSSGACPSRGLERNEPVSSCNIQTDESGAVRPGARQTGVNGAIVVPIRDPSGAVRGTLGIGVHRDYEYREDEVARLLEAGAGIHFADRTR